MGAKYGLTIMDILGSTVLVNINKDGTIMAYHGGSEIGQGIHTKVAQAIAMTLECPFEVIRIGPTNTDIIPHTGSTGGSVTSEAVSEAARQACIKLNKRLSQVKNDFWSKEKRSPTWQELILEAKKRNLLLSETGNINVDGRRNTKKSGPPYAKFDSDYYAWGVACSEVEVDLLTGEISILRSDIYYDTGTTINPLIDIGQIEGAFIFGLGYYFREEVLTDHNGRDLSDSTWEYKPPCSHDIPIDFRINLITNPHQKRFFGSKAVGEPPMLLSYSAVSALREAILSTRLERGLDVNNLEFIYPLQIDAIKDLVQPNLLSFE